MLLRFRFSNFRSFRRENELSMISGPFSDLPRAVFKPPGMKEGVLPVAAIYGANASGKTNVLKALEFMKGAVENSHRAWQPDGRIPREPFLLDETARKVPSVCSVDVVITGVRYQYGFSVDDKTVHKEWLDAYPNGRKQAWFSREAGKPIVFSSKLSGENKAIEALTRPNSLYLSAAAQNNHEILTPIYLWFLNALAVRASGKTQDQRLTTAACYDESDRKRIAQFLKIADLGIVDIGLNLSEKNARIVRDFSDAVKLEGGKAKEFVKRAEVMFKEVELLHSAGEKSIPFSLSQESDGTVAYLSMLGPLLAALKMGRVFCIDELDASLHPLLAMQIINLFNNPELNESGAQLIFNTHDSNLLSSKLLRRDQIWFTEKQPDGSGHLYPLTDFKPRLGENIENGYLQGRYGAIPFLNSESFVAALESGDGKG
jgi:AAA15 family ATPase/GTPase